MDTHATGTTSPLPDAPSMPLHDRDQAEAYVAMVCFKHGPPRLHGVELEWTVHHRDDPRRPVGADQLLRALGPHAPQTISPHAPVPLSAGSLVSVEPGGQVEISPPPSASAAQIVGVGSVDAAALAGLLARFDLMLGDHATDPQRPPTRVLQLPRYAAMQAAFDAVGPYGSQMMCSTASMQVCLDAGSEDQIASRWRAAHALGPALVTLFANSPRLEGRSTGWASTRLRATLGTFPPFTSPPNDTGDPPRAWARMAMDAPVICLRRAGPSWSAPRGLTFGRWVTEPALVGRRPSVDDLDYHLTTLFPPVRAKGYLEIRYLDMQPGSQWVTAFALLAALMARPSTVDQVLDLTVPTAGRWSDAARLGADDPLLRQAAREVAELGAGSLGHLDLTGTQQTHVLEGLARRLDTLSQDRRRSA